MRLRFVLLFLLALFTISGPAARALNTTPTEARALAAAERDHTAYVLPPAKLAEAESLKHSGMVLHFASLAWQLIALFLLLQLGLVARMRNVANNLSKKRWPQGFIFWLQLLLAMSLLVLPLDLYAHLRLVHAGLSVQGLGSWFKDQLIGLLLTYILGGLGVMALLGLIRRFPKIWWLPVWVAFNVVAVVGFFATPYVIDPLFNHFEPLSQSNPALVAQLERVVAKGKGVAIPPERMFLMRASSKTTQLNAYVTGIGASKRIVVWDTSISKGTPDEILLIFGHEMGHYALGHIVRGMLLTLVISFFALLLAFYLFQWMLARFGTSWRVPLQNNWGAVAVFLLAVYLVQVPLEPLENALSRQQEHAADVYGMEVVHGIIADPQTTGRKAFDVLGEGSLAAPDPEPWYVFWTSSHPPIWLRAGFAKAYDPWAAGEAPKYFGK